MEVIRPEIITPKFAFNQFLNEILLQVSQEPKHINKQITGPVSKKPLIVIADQNEIRLSVPIERIQKTTLTQEYQSHEPELRADIYKGIVSFNLQSINRKVSDSPAIEDFFPKEFVNFVLNKYYLAFGKEISTCRSWWFEGSDNLYAFRNNIDMGMSEIDAAKNTWSGRVFSENGFDKVSEIKTKSRSNVVVYFNRTK